MPVPSRPAGIATLFALFALAGAAVAGPLPEFDASTLARPSDASLARSRAAAAEPAIRSLARVQSTDERYGLPSFVWAHRRPAAPAAARPRPGRTLDQAARAHLSDLAPLYRLRRDDVLGAKLQRLHDTGRGPIIASYRQEIDGIEVFRDEIKVCMDRDLGLVSVSGYLPSRAAVAAPVAGAFRLGAARAVGLALADFGGLPAEPSGLGPSVTDEGGYERFAPPAAMRARTDGLAVSDGPRARRVWFHVGERLEPAWYVEVMGETAAYAYVFSARDGALLFRHGLMQDVAFSYRVWAGSAAPFTPMDGPQGDDASPHPTGLPDLYSPTLVAPNLVTLQNGPISTSDPWLPPGATQTTGNNVDAYVDLAAPDGFSAGDFRATTTGPGAFDRTYDTNQSPSVSADQRMASITTLFYLNNFLHDMFYDSGFDEAAGNAQTDNYGRGGLGGDPIRAEAQDYGGTNNANMSTPADGGMPRMQMYVFNNRGANLIVHAPGAIAGTYPAGIATGFGPQNFVLTGDVVAGQDAIAPVDDACSAITSAVAGKIALVDRGICSFASKAQNAQNAGAIGVIIVNNVVAASPPGMGGTAAGITIPVLSVTQADGALIRAQLASGVNVTLNRPVQVQRDGTIDGHIVAHEWGHYISNRLIGNSSGLSNQQGGGMGEGWGDFHALLMTVRPGDDPTGVYCAGGYALSGQLIPNNAYYFGVRRYPYSTDLAKSPLTFQHIQNGTALPAGPPLSGDPTGANNAEVHNTGEVWCSMLWECYAALLGDTGRLTFDEAHQRMKDYLVAGYLLTPNAPTFVEARDAILAAAAASDPADFALMAQAFAKRGLGTGAVAPPRTSTDNVGVTESFSLGGDLVFVGATLTDDLHSCDADSYVDAGERGTLSITLANSGATALGATTVTVTSPGGEVTFPSGNVAGAPGSSPFSTFAVDIPVELSGPVPLAPVALDIAFDDPGLFVAGPRLASFTDYLHVDEAPSATDDVEAHTTTWIDDAAAGSAGDPWGRTEVAPGNRAFFVPDAGGIADLRLVSAPFAVSAVDPLSISFVHRYSFETGSYDGGVMELSDDFGSSWTDLGASAVPGYSGTLTSGTGNPLGGRAAWVGDSPGYPSMTAVTVNLGTVYAGQTVMLRFRHATDVAIGAPGWWIDDVSLSGVDSQPFFQLVSETGPCDPLAVGDQRPTAIALAIAGGNPSRGSARLRFALPEAHRVRLTVHDVAGRLVATLADGAYGPGWHDAAFSRGADGLAPGVGVYFAKLDVDGRRFTRRLVVVR
jgi:hypothetical protein